MRAIFAVFLTLVIWFCASQSALGQAVVLRPNDVLPTLKEVSPSRFYINGPLVHGLSDEMAETYYPLGDAGKFILALVTLRLADQGGLDLNEPVAKALPDLMDFNPWEVAVTPAHLLSETAGFAYPPANSADTDNIPLRYFLIKLRGAGQIALNDPVGWHLLAAFLEAKSQSSIQDLLVRQVFEPLMVPTSGLRWPSAPSASPYSLPPLGDVQIRGSALAKILQILANHHPNSFLSDRIWPLLSDKPLWAIGPLGPMRMAGLHKIKSSRYQWVGPAPCAKGITFLASPAAGVVFVQARSKSASNEREVGCPGAYLLRAANKLAQAHMPPNRNPDTEVAGAHIYASPPTYEGRYSCIGGGASLRDRIGLVKSCGMVLSPQADGTIDVTINVPPPPDFSGDTSLLTQARIYREVAPYYLRSNNGSLPIDLSPYKLGGYAARGDARYVKTGVLGYLQGVVGDYLLFFLLGLLSAVLHLRSKTSVQWRRFAAFSVIGGLLVGFGLFAELNLWVSTLYDLQMPWLITLWRTGLNIGLMLVLSLPMLAMAFVQQQNMPKEGIALLFAGPHLGLISLSAIGLFLTTIIWGVAGTFTAY